MKRWRRSRPLLLIALLAISLGATACARRPDPPEGRLEVLVSEYIHVPVLRASEAYPAVAAVERDAAEWITERGGYLCDWGVTADRRALVAYVKGDDGTFEVRFWRAFRGDAVDGRAPGQPAPALSNDRYLLYGYYLQTVDGVIDLDGWRELEVPLGLKALRVSREGTWVAHTPDGGIVGGRIEGERLVEFFRAMRPESEHYRPIDWSDVEDWSIRPKVSWIHDGAVAVIHDGTIVSIDEGGVTEVFGAARVLGAAANDEIVCLRPDGEAVALIIDRSGAIRESAPLGIRPSADNTFSVSPSGHYIAWHEHGLLPGAYRDRMLRVDRYPPWTGRGKASAHEVFGWLLFDVSGDLSDGAPEEGRSRGRCPKCGYDLAGLGGADAEGGAPCPECGATR